MIKRRSTASLPFLRSGRERQGGYGVQAGFLPSFRPLKGRE